MFNRIILIAICSTILVACSHSPKTYIADDNVCNFKMNNIEFPLPQEQNKTEFLNERLAALSNPSGPLLFLSGGSQHGAFGAGYLKAWKKSKKELPQFSIVTGVSTGALQATGAFINEPDLAVEGYTISSEGEILETYIKGAGVESDNEAKFSFFDVLTLIKKGSVADLAPLRKFLTRMLDDRVLLKVAEQSFIEGANADTSYTRKLYAGTTDVDNGGAVAIDLTDLAVQFKDATTKKAQDDIRACYVEALIASSTVPAASQPVFIKNRMYLDGGVRFSVFAEDIGEEIKSLSAARKDNNKNDAKDEDAKDEDAKDDDAKDDDAKDDEKEELPKTPVYIILNGNGMDEQNCEKVDEQLCKDYPPTGGTKGEHNKWNFATVAMRSVELLTNQVLRLSIYRAENLNRDFPIELVFAKIDEEEKDAHPYPSSKMPESLLIATPENNNNNPKYEGTKTCAEWRDIDDIEDHPVEFHPRYMRCLISYGKKYYKDRNKTDKQIPPSI